MDSSSRRSHITENETLMKNSRICGRLKAAQLNSELSQLISRKCSEANWQTPAGLQRLPTTDSQQLFKVQKVMRSAEIKAGVSRQADLMWCRSQLAECEGVRHRSGPRSRLRIPAQQWLLDAFYTRSWVHSGARLPLTQLNPVCVEQHRALLHVFRHH